jgi:hypothetical protein
LVTLPVSSTIDLDGISLTTAEAMGVCSVTFNDGLGFAFDTLFFAADVLVFATVADAFMI